MWAKDYARSFAGKELADRLDFLGCSLLLSNHMIETKHHQRVGVGESPFVERQSLACLVNPLVNSDRVPRRLADERLESNSRQVEQLKRTRNSLQEHFL
jgi:hypothetical protein